MRKMFESKFTCISNQSSSSYRGRSLSNSSQYKKSPERSTVGNNVSNGYKTAYYGIHFRRFPSFQIGLRCRDFGPGSYSIKYFIYDSSFHLDIFKYTENYAEYQKDFHLIRAGFFKLHNDADEDDEEKYEEVQRFTDESETSSVEFRSLICTTIRSCNNDVEECVTKMMAMNLRREQQK